MLIAGIDAGTQSVKTIIYDTQSKKIVASGKKELELHSGPNGEREQEASWWIDAIIDIFNNIPNDIKKDISAIGVSGQQHGFVPLDKDGNILTKVKLWCDTSTDKEVQEIAEAYGGNEKLIKNVGNTIKVGYTASKILHLKKTNPELFEKMDSVLLPHDYINYFLTGQIVMERGDASGTGLLNIYQSCWDQELCNIIDKALLDKLPTIVDSLSIIGTIRKEAATLLGLGQGTKVSAGGGDNMMAAIGTGIVENGKAAISLGTSGTLFTSTSKLFVDNDGDIASFSSSHGDWLPLLCTMNCTVASELWRKILGLSAKEFDAIASKAPIGSEGITLLPFFNGERVPNFPKGEGVLAGMNMSNMKIENIARAVIEGVTFEFVSGIEKFKSQGIATDTIILTGGGSNSSFWRQMISDMFNATVKVSTNGEAAAFGAALQAYSAMTKQPITEICKAHISYDDSKETYPINGNNEKYKEAYNKWLEYVRLVTPRFS